MQTTLTPVDKAFWELPEARRLCCGITAHLVDPSHIDPGVVSRIFSVEAQIHFPH